MESDVIWWDNFCGNNSQYNAFWNSSLSLFTNSPDLTDCFQKSILTWVTCSMLWLSSLFYTPIVLIRRKYVATTIKTSLLNVLKITCALVLSVISFSELLWYSTSSTSVSHPVDYVSCLIKMFTYILAAILTRVTYRKAIHSSGVLFVFWLLQLVVGIVTFRSMLLKPTSNFFKTTTSISSIFIFLSFIFCLFSDLLPAKVLQRLHGVSSKNDLQSSYSRRRELQNNKFHYHQESRELRKIENENKQEKLCPKLTAPFLSVLLFWWFTPKVVKGWRKTLSIDDIWKLRIEDGCDEIYPKFEANWNKAKQDFVMKQLKMLNKSKSKIPKNEDEVKKNLNKCQPSLIKTLFKTFYGYLVAAGVLQFCSQCVMFINPFALNLLLDYVSTKNSYTWHGVCLAVLIFVSGVVGVLLQHHNFNMTYSIGMRVKTAVTAAIYRKSLTISPNARRTTTTGEIVNLMSVDSQKLADCLPFFHFIWTSPFVFIVATVMLWQILGPSCLSGMAFLLVVLPLNSMIMAKMIRKYQSIQMVLKDARLKLMNQILMGVKILKLYAWEPYFTAKVLKIRDEELKTLKKSQTVGAVTYILWFCSSFLVALLSFATYVLVSSDNVLDPKTAFVSLSLIMMMNFPLTILAPAIMLLVQGAVSAKRIEKFLLQEDVDETSVTHYEDSKYAIDIRSGEFTWNDDDQKSTLTDIDLQIHEGELVAVVGSVGCGKSSLLSAVLGEIRKKEGSVNVKGKIAYVAQQAWIQNMSLRDNILFSSQYSTLKYNGIIEACALKPDLEVLPGGDKTEIGERGINLSGGQKQRISLARAVYQDVDVYLLDDTLSAVDAHVSKHIFDKVIGHNGLLKSKTRILVTHSISLLPKVDRIIVMNDGYISEQGTFDQLITRSGDFSEFLKTYMADLDDKIDDDEDTQTLLKLQRQMSITSDEERHTSDGEHIGLPQDQQWRIKRKRKRSSVSAEVESSKPSLVDESRLIKDETADEGNIKLSVITSYIRAAPSFYPLVLAISFVAFVSFHASTNIWLSQWTRDTSSNGTLVQDLTSLRLGVYAALGAGQTISVIGLILTVIYGCIKASETLHTRLVKNILKCPMSFYDTVPLGRILNRFSKDIDILDSNIPQFSQNLITTLCPLVSTIIIIAYTIPPFIGVVIPLLLVFALLQRVYISCARQIKRIDSIRRSPIYANFSETLNGTTSIRAFRQQDRFVQKSDQLLDDSQRVWFEVFTSNRWIGVWSEFIADLLIFFTALFAVLQKDSLDPSLVGLSLSFAFQINMSIIMTVRSSCELETYIVAAERIKEYSEMKEEAPWYTDGKEPLEKWPAEGSIEFNNYSTRYREGLDLVLRNVSISINSSEKVGIVGRTGAGKSSMTLALFRIVEPVSGDIIIDGHSISKLGLHDVRKKLTVIPQDPVLFSGSLRFNLDPADHFSDDEIWLALEQAHLKNYVMSLPDKIGHECGEDGTNLSVGQRQLVCLARALLRKSKILVMDEATAAIDLETDDLIQSTIRTQFKRCTVLTIAHRINTILDYDRILVLEKGEVKEFASPTDLLQDNNSMFYSLAKDSGLI